MKKYITLLAIAAVSISCTPTPDYKAQRDEVMKFHDIVMDDHGKLVSDLIKLDTLIHTLPALKTKYPATDTLKEKVTMLETQRRLNKAEDLMNDWMHEFDPDVSGKSNEEAVKYFKAERINIGRIDSIYRAELRISGTYLAKFNRQ